MYMLACRNYLLGLVLVLVEKFVFCLTGPYLLPNEAGDHRAASNSPLAGGASLIPPYEPPPQV